MAELGCTSGCSCHASEDGFWANHPEKGRRNTLVEGAGSLSDPWTISFIDSAQYRPVAGEIRYPDRSLNGSTVLNGTGVTVAYETSPGSRSLVIGYPQPLAINFIVEGNFFIVGAAAEFQANNDSGTSKSLTINSSHPTLGDVTIAGAVTAGLTTEDMVLTASGYTPGLFENELAYLGYGPQTQEFFITISETTTGSLSIKKLKFWVTTI